MVYKNETEVTICIDRGQNKYFSVEMGGWIDNWNRKERRGEERRGLERT